MRAACQLIEKVGATIVGISFLIELADLNGRQRLTSYKVHTVITY
jgi:adenine phosphoribosyltransferase